MSRMINQKTIGFLLLLTGLLAAVAPADTPHTYPFDGSTPAATVPPSPKSTDTYSKIGPHPDKLAMTDVTVDPAVPSLTVHFHHPRDYTLYRRLLFSSNAWTQVGTVTSAERSWTDTSVSVGTAYEYKLSWTAQESFPYGGSTLSTYFAAGIDVDQTGYRGRLILLVADDAASELAYEIDRLKRDLTGDGWRVQTLTVAADSDWYGDADSETIRGQLQTLYSNAPAGDKPKLLYVLGSVPVPWSGLYKISGHSSYFDYPPDGHSGHQGAYPTDSYYAELDGTWTDTGTFDAYRQDNQPGDKRWDQVGIPGEVELGVGRVDLRDLNVYTPLDEMTLLRRYLDKAHALRTKQRDFGRRGLHMLQNSSGGNVSADELALRTIPSIFGLSGYEYTTSLSEGENTADYVNQFSAAGSSPYFFAARTRGGGTYSGAPPYDAPDFVDYGADAAIWFGFQSYYYDWAIENNLMRAQLAAEGNSLGAFSVSHSGWFLHHMGLGYPVGLAYRETLNNDDSAGPYTGWESNDPRSHSGRVHMGYMGDPAVRPFQVKPVSNLTAAADGSDVDLSWTASPEASSGYHVYRSTNGLHGAYTKLTAAGPVSTGVVSGTVAYTDAAAPSGEKHYMVRSVKREETGSGSFLNAGGGVFASVPASGAPVLSVTPEEGSLTMAVGDTGSASTGLLTITNTGSGTLTGLAVESGSDWLDVSLSNTTVRLTVNTNANEFTVGSRGGSVTVSASGGLTNYVPVVLSVQGDQVRLLPSHDTFDEEDNPNGTHGNDDDLRIDQYSRSYLRFDLSAHSNKVAGSAVLVFQVAWNSFDTLRLLEFADDTWDESTLSYNNRPDPAVNTGALLFASSSIVDDSVIEVDVTGYVNDSLSAGDTQLSFFLDSDDPNESGFGLISSEEAGIRPNLTVTFGPLIESEPQDTAVVSGSNATLSVTAVGSGSLSYQWYEGSRGDTASPVGGATGATLTTGPITGESTFWVRVTDGTGAYTDSRTATVSIITAPSITVQPQSVIILAGESADLSVSADGGALSYQWYEGDSGDTSTPVGEDSASYTTPPLTAQTSYWVRVSNLAGSVDSDAATVSITAEAPSLKINLGGDAGADWNNYATESVFGGGTLMTDSSPVYTTGADADGVTVKIERSRADRFFDVFPTNISATAYPTNWLNEIAARSAFGLAEKQTLNFKIDGLPAATYSIELYCYHDTVADGTGSSNYDSWKIDGAEITAGLSGSLAVTTDEYDTTEEAFEFDKVEDKVARWSNVLVSAGQTVEVDVRGIQSHHIVANALIIKGGELQIGDDTTPPARITDLAAVTSTYNSVTVSWTTPGDDGMEGAATSYDLRYSTSPITNESTFAAATQVADAPTPGVSGSTETYTLHPLDLGTTYHVAIKAADEAGNTNELSNAASGTTAASPDPGTELNRILFDFGRDYKTTVGNWNNIYDIDATAPIADAVDTNGLLTGIQLDIPATFDYISESGFGSDVYPEDAQIDYFYVKESLGGQAHLRLSNLNTNLHYKVVLFANNASSFAGQKQVTTFSNAWGRVEVDPYNNTNRLVSLDDVPAPDGTLDIYAVPDTADDGIEGNAFINVLDLRIMQPKTVSIADHPQDCQIYYGFSTTLTVNATGSGTVHYQWYEGLRGDTSTPVGTDAAELTTPSLTNDTRYWVRVSDDNNSTDSYFADVDVLPPGPAITEQPQNQFVTSGTSAVLSVTAVSAGTIDYQWYQGQSGDTSTPVGADSDTFVTPVLTNSASYWVRLTDGAGTNDSRTASVFVRPGQPWVAYHGIYDNVRLNFDHAPNVTGGRPTPDEPMELQDIESGAGVGTVIHFEKKDYDSFWTTSAEMAMTGTDAYDLFGGIVSIEGTVRETFPDHEMPHFYSFTLSGLDSNATYSLHFFINNNDGYVYEMSDIVLSNAVSATPDSSSGIGDNGDADPFTFEMHVPNTTAGRVVGWRDIQPAGDSVTVVLTVDHGDGPFVWPWCYLPAAYRLERESEGPDITQQPQSATLSPGGSTTLDVQATGAGTLSYQWYQGASGETTQPVGGNAPQFVTPPVTSAVSYWVRATDENGSTDSDTAMLRPSATGWTAYHNIDKYISGNADHVTAGHKLRFNLLNQADGADTYATLGFYMPTYSYVNSPDAADGTDADAIFDGFVNCDTTYSDNPENFAGNSFQAQINGLAPGNRYALRLYLTATSDLGDQLITLEGFDSCQEASSAGVGDHSDGDPATFVQFTTNTTTGYIVGWTNIVPGGSDGKSLLLRIESLNSTGTVVSPAAWQIVMEEPQAAPFITADPVDTVVASNNTVTLTVGATGADPLSYQWYQGASGDTSVPVGSNAVAFTSPALTADVQYWVRVSNAQGSADSAAASITVITVSEYEAWISSHGVYGPDADPAADPDGDGHDNWSEMIAGTMPNDDGSVFQINALTYAGPGAATPVLNWNSVEGRSYSVFWTSNLLHGSFSLLESNLVATPPANAWTGVPHRSGYYQIKVEDSE